MSSAPGPDIGPEWDPESCQVLLFVQWIIKKTFVSEVLESEQLSSQSQVQNKYSECLMALAFPSPLPGGSDHFALKWVDGRKCICNGSQTVDLRRKVGPPTAKTEGLQGCQGWVCRGPHGDEVIPVTEGKGICDGHSWSSRREPDTDHVYSPLPSVTAHRKFGTLGRFLDTREHLKGHSSNTDTAERSVLSRHRSIVTVLVITKEVLEK
ncbi:hypothetical protein H920_13425 [Fukomys damarensis]|uniref:Uncharacterized protein n=1 Tax=Fukomys damarensis TaxID=885580 RepID=A0A091CZI9_FUKDA|nr:hypothetical protein H920_13425 [Fukomys damarensis]